jgi:hypothetical protein
MSEDVALSEGRRTQSEPKSLRGNEGRKVAENYDEYEAV